MEKCSSRAASLAVFSTSKSLMSSPFFPLFSFQCFKTYFCCNMTNPPDSHRKRGRPRKYHTDAERQQGTNARRRERYQRLGQQQRQDPDALQIQFDPLSLVQQTSAENDIQGAVAVQGIQAENRSDHRTAAVVVDNDDSHIILQVNSESFSSIEIMRLIL